MKRPTYHSHYQQHSVQAYPAVPQTPSSSMSYGATSAQPSTHQPFSFPNQSTTVNPVQQPTNIAPVTLAPLTTSQTSFSFAPQSSSSSIPPTPTAASSF